MRHGRTFIALFAVIVEAEGGLDCRVDEVAGPQCIFFEEEVPLIYVLEVVVGGECVGESFLVDEAEKVQDDFEGVLALVAKQSWELFEEQLRYALPAYH